MAIVLAVPTCLLLALTGLGVADRAHDWSAARATEAQVGIVLREQDLVREVQRERGLTNGLLNGAVRYRDDVRRQRMRTDAARASLRAALSDGNGDLPAAAAAALIDVGGAGAPDGDRRIAQGVQALARATEAVALERGSLNGVFAARRFRSGEYLDFTEVRATRVAALGQFRQLASGAEQSALDRAFATAAARRVTGYEAKAGAGADGSTLDVDPARWWADMTTLVDDLHGVRKQVGDDVRARADQVGGAATRELAGFLALGALILAVASALAVFSARSITRPLGALADEADAVAGTRLPDAVGYIQEADPDTPPPAEPEAAEVPGTAREISRLTAALRNAERTAVGLAVEQAVLRRNSTESLAGLGRRNQALLSRRLGLITTLESQELDPDALAELFELDHLATRMRRNAESLLVLAGEESPARRWPGTVTVSEVVQSAVSEAEQYQRVAVTDLEQCRVRAPVSPNSRTCWRSWRRTRSCSARPAGLSRSTAAGRRRVLPGRGRPGHRDDGAADGPGQLPAVRQGRSAARRAHPVPRAPRRRRARDPPWRPCRAASHGGLGRHGVRRPAHHARPAAGRLGHRGGHMSATGGPPTAPRRSRRGRPRPWPGRHPSGACALPPRGPTRTTPAARRPAPAGAAAR